MTSVKNITNKQPNWTIIGLICVAISLIFFQPFIGTICAAALVSYLLFSIYKKISNKFSDNIAGTATLIISYIIILAPIVFILVLAIGQAISLANYLAGINIDSGTTLNATMTTIVDKINSFLLTIGSEQRITSDSIIEVIQKVIPSLITSITDAVLQIFNNLPIVFTSVIVYSFLFTAFLRYNKPMREYIKLLSPFDEKSSEKYFEKSGLIVTASLKGQFIISFVTAVSSALLLFLLNLQQYFMFFVILFTILGMIPLGAGVVMIPIAIIAMISGNFWPGFWVLAIYLVVICNIDTFLRPHLIPKKASIIPALTTLATFCGIYSFGVMGIVYGPLIVIILKTTIEIYASTRSENNNIKSSS